MTEERRVYVRCVSCTPEHQARFRRAGRDRDHQAHRAGRGLHSPAPCRSLRGRTGGSGPSKYGRLALRPVQLGDRLLDGRILISGSLPDGVRAVLTPPDARFAAGRQVSIREATPMNLALRDVQHGLGRFILTCAGLSLLLGVVDGPGGIYRGLVTEALGLAKAANADILGGRRRQARPFRRKLAHPARHTRRRRGAGRGRGRRSDCLPDLENPYRGGNLRAFVVGAMIGRPCCEVRIVEAALSPDRAPKSSRMRRRGCSWASACASGAMISRLSDAPPMQPARAATLSCS